MEADKYIRSKNPGEEKVGKGNGFAFLIIGYGKLRKHPERSMLTMSEFNPDKLSKKYLPPANMFGPLEKRRYTLTHSDYSAELFLTIGTRYDLEAVNEKLRDEVLAEWKTRDGEYILLGKVHVSNGDYDKNFSRIRYLIFKKELPLALTGIIYGDKDFFIHYPWLLDSPIIIHFESVYPEYNDVLYYGTPRQYLSDAAIKKLTKTQA